MTLSLQIESLAFGGDGIAVMPDGRKCFVPGGLPGDSAEVEIIQEKSRFARGQIRRILEKSPSRIESFCPLRQYTPPCPSCVYAELPYTEELAWKQKQFAFFLSRLCSPGCILPPFPSPMRTGYRGKITLSCENGRAGYRAADNTTLIPVTSCALAHGSINDLLRRTHPDPGTERLCFRRTEEDGAVCRQIPGRNGTAVRILTERIGAFGSFRVPETSFFQVNLPVACELIRRVLGILDELKPAFLLDLFCGAGIFSLTAAEHVQGLRTLGAELDADAVRSARENAARRGLSGRCRFQRCDAADFTLPEDTDASKILLLTDPPRTGMEKKMIERIRTLGPAHVLYISCAPDMLKRDLERLNDLYEVRKTGLLDMFPATAHFESMTLLEKR